jgi:hypothetical protein
MVLPDWPVNILKGTRMSEIESQTNDLLQLQGELERIFTVLEGGTDLSKEQIDLLRYGCGFEPVDRQRNFLREVFADLNPYGVTK